MIRRAPRSTRTDTLCPYPTRFRSLYNEKTGSSLTHVPYKGAGDAMNDLLAGRVHIYMNNIPSFIAHVGTGAVRPLALAAKKRSELLPDVPTTGEASLEGMEMGSWYGLVAPDGTPPEAIGRLYDAMKTMPQSEELKKRLASIGTEVTVSDSPEQFGQFMEEELAWWRKVRDNPVFRQ